MKVNCPTCQTEVDWVASSQFRPFCSERCKLIDLGEWADESHKIAGEALEANTQQLDEQDIEKMLAKQQQPFFKSE